MFCGAAGAAIPVGDAKEESADHQIREHAHADDEEARRAVHRGAGGEQREGESRLPKSRGLTPVSQRNAERGGLTV